jgi:hypothetical protein
MISLSEISGASRRAAKNLFNYRLNLPMAYKSPLVIPPLDSGARGVTLLFGVVCGWSKRPSPALVAPFELLAPDKADLAVGRSGKLEAIHQLPSTSKTVHLSARKSDDAASLLA